MSFSPVDWVILKVSQLLIVNILYTIRQNTVFHWVSQWYYYPVENVKTEAQWSNVTCPADITISHLLNWVIGEDSGLDSRANRKKPWVQSPGRIDNNSLLWLLILVSQTSDTSKLKVKRWIGQEKNLCISIYPTNRKTGGSMSTGEAH